MKPKPNALSWLVLSLVVIVLDQLSKWWALAALQPAGTPHPVIPGFLNWTLRSESTRLNSSHSS